MKPFLDFIFDTIAGGLLWMGAGLIFLASVKRIKNWTKPRTDSEQARKFAGICSIIIGICVLLNIIYDYFHHV